MLNQGRFNDADFYWTSLGGTFSGTCIQSKERS